MKRKIIQTNRGQKTSPVRGNHRNKVSERDSRGVCRNVTGWQKTQEARAESKGQPEEMPAGHLRKLDSLQQAVRIQGRVHSGTSEVRT